MSRSPTDGSMEGLCLRAGGLVALIGSVPDEQFVLGIVTLGFMSLCGIAADHLKLAKLRADQSRLA